MYLMISLITLFAFIFTPVYAGEARPVYNAKNSAQDKPAGMRTLNYVRNTPDSPSKKDEEIHKDSDEVWEKYKSLAAGQSEPEKETEIPDKKSEQHEDIEKVESIPAPETGFASILADYKKNKAERAQMRTLSVSKESDLPEKKTDKE